MIDVTDKVKRKTTDFQRKFRLCLQVEIPDPEPADAGGKTAGLDLGVRHLAAVADSHGNERLYNVPSGCKRHGGDKIDRLRMRQSKYKRGSREWGKRPRDKKGVEKDIQQAKTQRDRHRQTDNKGAVRIVFGRPGSDQNEKIQRKGIKDLTQPRDGILPSGRVQDASRMADEKEGRNFKTRGIRIHQPDVFVLQNHRQKIKKRRIIHVHLMWMVPPCRQERGTKLFP